MSEQDLIDRAQKAVGDADTIIAAAWFQPRGTSGGTSAGMAIGSEASDMVGGGLLGAAASIAGTAIGFEKGKKSGGFATDRTDGMVVHAVSYMSMVAVSETRIYGWKVNVQGGHRIPTEQMFAFDRSEVVISVHSRIGVRTFEVIHEATSEKWELESPRITGHLSFVVKALHQDVESA